MLAAGLHVRLHPPDIFPSVGLCRRQHAGDTFYFIRRAHLVAHLLPLQHQPIAGWTAAVLWWCRSPTTHAHRRFITGFPLLQINHPKFPLPLIHCSERIEKLLLPMKPEIA